MTTRPEILYPYFAPISSLKGVGPKSVPIIEAHIGKYVRDLLFFLPNSVTHRPVAPLNEDSVGKTQTFEVTIVGHSQAAGRKIGRIECESEGATITLVYFHYFNGLADRHPVGAKRYVSGLVEKFGSKLQITHPDYLVAMDKLNDIPVFEPHYPGCEGLGSKTIARLIKSNLLHLNLLHEWNDKSYTNNMLWASFNDSLRSIHFPKDSRVIEPQSQELSRLAYDEALAHQIALKSRKANRTTANVVPIHGDGLAKQMLEVLPFQLTRSQNLAIKAIRDDLSNGRRMNRLLQGDVGSGKTVVALVAALDVISQGAQVVFMAPTEILARQHYETARDYLGSIEIQFDILTGSDKGQKRKNKLEDILYGKTKLAFGTHALFQEGVTFRNLQLAIIDEQHRFGVNQRQRLFLKGENVHLLSMSATPIPRTLALVAYGEADLTILDEKPAGRQPIVTAVLPRERMTSVIDRLAQVIQTGAQAYWVCPLVEETEDSDLIAIEHRFEYLSKQFNNQVGLVHGRMHADDKNSVIQRFLNKDIKILCATTVIEVGVNVPNATIMIIEQAERFGLSQLHQLRGRVGRGCEQSSCLLLYDNPLSKKSKERLELLRGTEDGFLIAEADWKMRGEGDLLGAKQSGAPDYRFIDLLVHQDLIQRAAKEAEYLVGNWDKISTERRQALNELQHLFDWRYDQVQGLD